MPIDNAAELVGVYVQVPRQLRERFRKYCKTGNWEFTSEVRLALERHLAKPPGPRERSSMLAVTPVKKKGRPKKTDQ